jgi:hypothetical protein
MAGLTAQSRMSLQEAISASRGIAGSGRRWFLRPDCRRAATMNMQMLLEAAMLLCFGLAWPIATMKMLRTGRAEGKGLGFTIIIWTGYLAGAVSKVVAVDAPDVSIAPVFWLYLLNSVTVGINGALQWYLPRRAVRLVRAVASAAQVAAR